MINDLSLQRTHLGGAWSLFAADDAEEEGEDELVVPPFLPAPLEEENAVTPLLAAA